MYQLADNFSSTPRNEISGNLQFMSDSEHQAQNSVPRKSSAAKFDYLDENRDGLSSRSFLNYVATKNSIALGGADCESSPHRETLNILQNISSVNQNAVKAPMNELDPLNSFVNLKLSEKLHYSDIQSEDSKFDEAKSMLSKDSRAKFSSKKRADLRLNRSMDYAASKTETKEPASAETKSCRDDGGTSFYSDIVISKKRGDDELKKSGFVKRNLLPSKPVTISLTFDAFVDQVKGHESTSIASNYPSYKIDKRLIFLGKEVDFPWHIISYHSTFRKLWNLFIIGIIIYQIFWYPLAVTFITGDAWPVGTLIFEIVSIFIFALDILLNVRTTYSNENNEEIIDGKMMSRNYMSTRLFLVDVITTLPVAEVLLLVLISSEHRWLVYSLVVMVRMLRFFKIADYLQHRTLNAFAKLLRIFITFFIFVHWASCVWYIILKAEFPDPPAIQNLWFPNNLRMIATSDDDLLAFYYGMPTIKVYGFTLLSVFMLVVGSDMAPTTDLQIWVSVLVGLFGAVSLAYIFGLVTLTINRANEESQLYQQQLEELKQKLRVNKIPHNLRVKVMEYFYYSWRKHSVLKKMDDFSELSIPLQRDIALYQHQEMIMKVPLFRELDPVEILSIVQKLKTSIYMPGDKIIREGERGTEMFFIQEGIVEKIYKKAALKPQEGSQQKHSYERVLLERGSYFGEVALMSNSKRVFDVNAFEFCILYSFSRSDYESLKSEFRDIGPRLRSGLKHYKNTHMGQLIQILRNLDIFQNFTEAELRRIGDEYLEEMFVDPDKVILAPKNRTNAIYVIFAGSVKCYKNDDETKNYVNYLKRSDNKDNWTIVDMDEPEDIDCLDDDILNLEKDKLSMDDQKKRLDLIRSYTYGEYFGTLDFDINEIKCNNYYLTDTGCQIGAITQALKSQMAIEDPGLYEKLRNNIIRCCPRRIMMPIEEESDSSFTTKNNTVIKRPSRRTSVLSDLGKRPALIKTASLNQKEEDIAGMRGELQQLEEQMNYFKNLIINVNAKLASALPGGYPGGLKSQEASPLKKNRGKSLIPQTGSLAKISNRDLANTLLGVDEEDLIEESQSIKKEEE